MVDIQPVKDIFGLGRLADTIRQGEIDEQNRGLAEQQAVTRGLQQESLGLGIEQKRQSLADLAAGRQGQADLTTAVQGSKPGESKTMAAINFLKGKDPAKAQELITSTLENAGKISKFNPQGGIDFVNQELGTSWTLEEETPDTFKVNQGDKISLINKSSGEVIQEFPVAAKPGTGETIRSLPGGGFEIIRGGDQKPTKGTIEADKAFGKAFVDWRISGGSADSDKQISQLETALSELKSGKNLTGPIIGSTPNKLLGVVNPDAINTKELVEEVVQRNLRLVLGAQFTEKEGERLIARAFNQNLEEDVNAQRVGLLLNQMKKAASAKDAASDYFAENGTLTGFKGKIYNLSDFKNINFDKAGSAEIPKDLPSGTKFVGTKGGKNVFETPDGKRFMDTGE